MSPIDESAARKKVLIVTRNLPPLVGGMERFNQRVITQLQKEYEVAVCGPKGCEQFLSPGMAVESVQIRPLPLFMLRMLFAGLRAGRGFNPDVVLAGSGLTAPIAFILARIYRAKSIVFLYGLDLVVPNWVYQAAWLPAIRACDGFIAISRYTYELALARGIPKARMNIVNPGVDFRTPLAQGMDFRASHKLGSRPILLSVGRLTRRKGLVEFIEQCLPSVVAGCPEVILVSMGGEASDALTGGDGSITDRARTAAERLGLQDHLMMLGSVSDEELQAAYACGQVHVFPILATPGDVEGFGIVALEAAIAGIPTVAFTVGGVPDAVSEGVSGCLIAEGDYDAMAAAVLNFLQGASWKGSQREACIEFARSFEWDAVGPSFIGAIRSLAAL